MNSYPPELLAQLAPVMFVAGLDAPNKTEPSTPSPDPQAQPPETPPPSTPSKPSDPFTVLIHRLREALGVQRKVAIYQPPAESTARKPIPQFQIQLVSRDVHFPPRKLVRPEDPAYANAHSPLSPLTPSSPLYPDGLKDIGWLDVARHIVLRLGGTESPSAILIGRPPQQESVSGQVWA